MSATSKQKLAKRMMWAARVIGLLTAAFSLMFLIVDTIVRMAMQQGGFIEDVLTGMPVVVVVAGCIVSWWRQGLAGILLVLASFALSGIGSRYYGRGLFSGFPYLVAGLLFLFSWWLSRKTGSSAIKEVQTQEQKGATKKISIAAFILWGVAGFGIGGAIGGAIWPSIGQPYLGFVLMGAIGGSSLGLALKDWRRVFISGVAGALGFGAGSYLNILFSILGGSLGVSLGLALNDWRRAGLLFLTGMIGFNIAIFNTWNLSSGEALWSAIMLAVWGVVGGAGLGTALGYLEKRKADKGSR